MRQNALNLRQQAWPLSGNYGSALPERQSSVASFTGNVAKLAPRLKFTVVPASSRGEEDTEVLPLVGATLTEAEKEAAIFERALVQKNPSFWSALAAFRRDFERDRFLLLDGHVEKRVRPMMTPATPTPLPMGTNAAAATTPPPQSLPHHHHRHHHAHLRCRRRRRSLPQRQELR